VEGLQSADDWRAALAAAARLHAYSFGNSLLIMAAHRQAYADGLVPDPEPDVVAGYGTWLSLGRHLIRGQHGYPILRTQLATTRTAVAFDGTERRLGARERTQPGERLQVEQTVRGWAVATVFARSQTEGADLPTTPGPVLLTGQAPRGLWAGARDELTATGFALRVAPAEELGSKNGITNYATRQVTVRDDLEPAAAIKTALHELGHVVLHDPLVRSGQIPVEEITRGVREVEAESFAFVVASAHGMDTSAYSLPYVASWAGGKDPAAVVRATAQRVTHAAKAVLDRLPTAHGGGGRPPARSEQTDQPARPRPLAAAGVAGTRPAELQR
jgi:hypothetical protein